MGLIKATIILLISIFLSNFILGYKKKFKNIPIINKLFKIKNIKLYSIILFMTLILLLV